MPDQTNHHTNIEKFKKILLCYALLLAVTGIYFDFISHQKPPHLGIINFTLSLINLSVIGILLYHWEKIRKWNAAIDHAGSAPESQPENILAAG